LKKISLRNVTGKTHIRHASAYYARTQVLEIRQGRKCPIYPGCNFKDFDDVYYPIN